MTKEDEEHFQAQTHYYYLCNQPFASLEVDERSLEERQQETEDQEEDNKKSGSKAPLGRKVRNHSYLEWENNYRGAAHNKCNLSHTNGKFVTSAEDLVAEAFKVKAITKKLWEEKGFASKKTFMDHHR